MGHDARYIAVMIPIRQRNGLVIFIVMERICHALNARHTVKTNRETKQCDEIKDNLLFENIKEVVLLHDIVTKHLQKKKEITPLGGGNEDMENLAKVLNKPPDDAIQPDDSGHVLKKHQGEEFTRKKEQRIKKSTVGPSTPRPSTGISSISPLGQLEPKQKKRTGHTQSAEGDSAARIYPARKRFVSVSE